MIGELEEHFKILVFADLRVLFYGAKVGSSHCLHLVRGGKRVLSLNISNRMDLVQLALRPLLTCEYMLPLLCRFESVYVDDEIRVVKDIRKDFLIVERAPYSWKE